MISPITDNLNIRQGFDFFSDKHSSLPRKRGNCKNGRARLLKCKKKKKIAEVSTKKVSQLTMIGIKVSLKSNKREKFNFNEQNINF